MKTGEELNDRKVPVVRNDPSPGKYRNNTPFADKLAKANDPEQKAPQLSNGLFPPVSK